METKCDSNFGKAISEKYGFKHLDTDDYFWFPTDPKYTTKRAPSERQRLLSGDIVKAEKCVISGPLCGWGDIFIPKFELVILVDTPLIIVDGTKPINEILKEIGLSNG